MAMGLKPILLGVDCLTRFGSSFAGRHGDPVCTAARYHDSVDWHAALAQAGEGGSECVGLPAQRCRHPGH